MKRILLAAAVFTSFTMFADEVEPTVPDNGNSTPAQSEGDAGDTSGVTEIETESAISFSNGVISFGENAGNVAIFNLQGRQVANASGVSSFDTAVLSHGAYVVTAQVNGQTVSTKIVK
jgi:hypothetical protein